MCQCFYPMCSHLHKKASSMPSKFSWYCQVISHVFIDLLHPYQRCVQRFSSWGGCKTCVPECLSKGDPNIVACAASLSTALNATTTSPPEPLATRRAQIARVRGWTYRGCYTDNVRNRALRERRCRGQVTVQRCAEFCKGYKYFGVEYSNEWVFSLLCS